MIRALRQLGEVPLPDGYLEDFARARITFRHHLVFEPEEQVRFVSVCFVHRSIRP